MIYSQHTNREYKTMSDSNLKLLNEFKHILAVYNYKSHSSAPVHIIDKDGIFYIVCFDYVTNEPIRLKSQRGGSVRLFATLGAAYKVIRTDLDWQGKIELLLFNDGTNKQLVTQS